MIKKHIEIKTYVACDIEVMVEIDYDNKCISLVEKAVKDSRYRDPLEQGMPRFSNKSWVFVKRGLEFMQGWDDILEAMRYAIKEASKELQSYLEAVEKSKLDQACDILDLATDMIKNKKSINKPKSKK